MHIENQGDEKGGGVTVSYYLMVSTIYEKPKIEEVVCVVGNWVRMVD